MPDPTPVPLPSPVLLPPLLDPPDRPAVRVGEAALTYAELAGLAARLAPVLRATGGDRPPRVAVLVERDLDTVVAVVSALAAGAQVVPINAAATAPELAHLVDDAAPDLVLHGARATVPESFAGIDRAAVDHAALARGASAPRAPAPDPSTAPAPRDRGPHEPGLVVYTSGTTGPPKGAVLGLAAIAADLDALASAWGWTPADVLVQALPLYHVHGLVLGLLGPLRAGAAVHHTGRFDPATTAAALADDAWAGGGTVVFGVPTIYARLADAAEQDRAVADALRRPRLLVSGSAGLPASVRERIEAATGQVIVERYGMTETLITTAVPAGARDRAGTVGAALAGVALRLVDDHGDPLPHDGVAMGELEVRTPGLFSGYVGRPDATAAADHDGWFRTGDVATIDARGDVRIVGRASADIIKSGGFKIGAGEIEDVLLAHPDVAEVAVRGVPDDDLGERVVAWVVVRPRAEPASDRGADPGSGAALAPLLLAHAAASLATHKCPRAVHLVDELPRNGMGKVRKADLAEPS